MGCCGSTSSNHTCSSTESHADDGFNPSMGFDPNEIQEKINNHPCYSEGAHHYYARIHVPVAPACNIQCNYCNRKFDCSNESRPGVTSGRLKPEQAVKKALFIGAEVKQLSVLGIAGPGDALANPKKTFETLRMMQEHAPDVKLCISTNALELGKYVDELMELNVDHITVTINTLDPKIGAKIYPWVYKREIKKKLWGEEGAQFLLERQLEGIRKCVEKGMLIKANSVLIPGINEECMPGLSAKLKSMGVFLHNIMPLLSEPEFGTKFALDGMESCSDETLKQVQEACGMEMDLMTHCQQCRADAVGIITEDRSDEFTDDMYLNKSIEELKEAYQNSGRQQFQENIEMFRAANEEATAKAEKEKELLGDRSLLIAVTSTDKKTINQHFGSAQEFLIYDVTSSKARFVEKRKAAYAYCNGPDHCSSDAPIKEIIQTLQGIDVLMTAKVGGFPKKYLEEAGIKCEEAYEDLEVKPSLLNFGRRELLARVELEAQEEN